jgi:hypothetical protein
MSKGGTLSCRRGGSSGTGLNIDARGAYLFHQEIAGDCHSRFVFNGGYFGSGDAGSLDYVNVPL